MLMKYSTYAHTPTYDSVHENEGIPADHEFPCAGYLPTSADLRVGFQLESVAANSGNDPIRGKLAVLGVVFLDRQQIAPGPRRPLKPLACRHGGRVAWRPP